MAAAWAVLGSLPIERLPGWAAHWLADGADGDHLRRLAGLSAAEVRETHDLLADALADCQTEFPSSLPAAARLAFDHTARLCSDGHLTELEAVDQVNRVLSRCDYHPEVADLPLSRLCLVNEEWAADWGRSEAQLVADVRDACRAQLAR